MQKTESIKLADGTELVPLEQKEKEALEAEIKTVLDKYGALYLPAIKKEETLSQVSQTAVLFLLKKKASEEITSPYVDNGESTDTTEETPETN